MALFDDVGGWGDFAGVGGGGVGALEVERGGSDFGELAEGGQGEEFGGGDEALGWRAAYQEPIEYAIAQKAKLEKNMPRPSESAAFLVPNIAITDCHRLIGAKV